MEHWKWSQSRSRIWKKMYLLTRLLFSVENKSNFWEEEILFDSKLSVYIAQGTNHSWLGSKKRQNTKESNASFLYWTAVRRTFIQKPKNTEYAIFYSLKIHEHESYYDLLNPFETFFRSKYLISALIGPNFLSSMTPSKKKTENSDFKEIRENYKCYEFWKNELHWSFLLSYFDCFWQELKCKSWSNTTGWTWIMTSGNQKTR